MTVCVYMYVDGNMTVCGVHYTDENTYTCLAIRLCTCTENMYTGLII